MFPYERFLPSEVLINKPISKEQFLTMGKMPPAAKRQFELLFKEGRIVGSLSERTCGLKSSADNSAAYEELQVLEVEIKSRSIGWMELHGFVKTVMQGIPYPMLLVVNYKGIAYKLFTAHFHVGRIVSDKVIVDELSYSAWIEMDEYTMSDDMMLSDLSRRRKSAATCKWLLDQWSAALHEHFWREHDREHLRAHVQQEKQIQAIREEHRYNERHKDSFGYYEIPKETRRERKKRENRW